MSQDQEARPGRPFLESASRKKREVLPDCSCGDRVGVQMATWAGCLASLSLISLPCKMTVQGKSAVLRC